MSMPMATMAFVCVMPAVSMALDCQKVMPAATTSSYAARRDKLNLSGLLNVLDGVVDTPGATAQFFKENLRQAQRSLKK